MAQNYFLPRWKSDQEALKAARDVSNAFELELIEAETKSRLENRSSSLTKFHASAGILPDQERLRTLVDDLFHFQGLPKMDASLQTAFDIRFSNTALREYHLDTLEDPFFLDVDHWTDRGVLCEDFTSTSQTDEQVDYYVRVILLDRPKLVDLLLRFASSHPAAGPWAFGILSYLDQNPQERVNCLKYEGTTWKDTPQGRLINDAKNDQGQTQWTNLCSLLSERDKQSRLRTFRYNFGRKAGSNVYCDPVTNAIEQIGIVLIKDLSGNSADGGFRSPRRPTTDLLALSRELELRYDDVYARLYRPSHWLMADVKEQLCRVLRQSLKLFKSLPYDVTGPVLDLTTPGGRFAYEDIKGDLTSLPIYVGGHALSLHVVKDITRAGLKGQDTYSGQLACAAGPLYQEHVAALLHISDKSASILRMLSPRMDFWSLILKHKKVAICLVILLREIAIIHPLVIDCDSSKVCNLFRIGLPEAIFKDAFSWHKALDANQILDSSIEQLLNPALHTIKWDSLRWPVWLLCVGEIFVL